MQIENILKVLSLDPEIKNLLSGVKIILQTESILNNIDLKKKINFDFK